MNASPTKRRVLGALDVNAQSPVANKTDAGKAVQLPRADEAGVKRSIEEQENAQEKEQGSQVKKARTWRSASVEAPAARNDEQKREASNSPEASSIFDNSAIDTSQATTVTEPESPLAAAALAPPPRRQPLTREEARAKADVLRLRLSLANYKLRTGQEDIPLERLQKRPLPNDGSGSAPQLPRLPARREDSSSSAAEGNCSGEQQSRTRLEGGQRKALPSARSQQKYAHPSPGKSLLPRPPPSAFSTPRRARVVDDDDGLTSSAIRGGAAKGLLSLSRGST